jgi:hypothetical protein
MSASATPRGLLFGTAAETYERFRPGYPDEVVDRTLAYAGRPVATAVEIGAGTGKATRAFASRGISIVALEPDPEMYAVLQRETAGLPVSTVRTTFEEYHGPRTRLLYAAAAWHWTEASTRWTHAAGLLEPGGVLALFGSQLRIADPDLETAARDAIGERLDDSAFRRGPQASVGWRVDDIEGSGLFEEVESHEVGREVVVPQKEYVGHLSTLSAYLRLPAEDRREVLRRITELVPAQVRLDASVQLQLARRRQLRAARRSGRGRTAPPSAR